ncbi:putative magnesium chelatase accessory protein [Natronocella acetinitrilica]|uniref:Magnesium chelatase accessory protein n=1 Tax=Natronocella acetinitrilica TaxID=414046 RepID=A0AAE3G4T5_9GAMM|nr:alpha/beta fold hydrolase BchO [Natronocella acetinitrilica]MCP1675841.1 putative magnesium chelatase accessory protein [Natronocella acetinitrilica]
MSSGLVWGRDGDDWPNRDHSRFVLADGMRWHVQVMGQGPTMLLLHGAGASTHSWRELAPLLAERFTVIAPDLPGHGFTSRPLRGGEGLAVAAAGLDSLLDCLSLQPTVVLGHSAGAAIGARMLLDQPDSAGVLISINGAMLPLPGLSSRLYGPAARLLADNPVAPLLIALRARGGGMVERLLERTGSTLCAESIGYYKRLARSSGHIGGVLAMMAQWDLQSLARDLPKLSASVWLLVGQRDGLVPPSEAERVLSMLPSGRTVEFPGLGHLAHEEAPQTVATAVLDAAMSEGILKVS